MTAETPSLVLDSWAVLAWLEDEPAAAQVEQLFIEANEGGSKLLISVVNAAEVWYIIAREVSKPEADRAIQGLLRIGAVFIEVDWDLARLAGEFKARCRISYADCFAVALAKRQEAELLTGDREFTEVESDIRVHWL